MQGSCGVLELLYGEEQAAGFLFFLFFLNALINDFAQIYWLILTFLCPSAVV